MIKRYGARLQVLCENDAGSFVDYLDHLAALTERDDLIEEMVESIKKVQAEKVRYCEAISGYMAANECDEHCEEKCDEPEEFLYHDEFNDVLARAEAMRGGKG